MPGKAYWIEAPHLMSLDYEGHVGPEDLEAVTTEGLQAVEQGPVYFIVDLSRMTTNPPAMIRASSKVKPFIDLVNHLNSRWFALVGPNIFAQLAIQVFFRNTGFKIFKERPEAEAFLRSMIEREIQRKGD